MINRFLVFLNKAAFKDCTVKFHFLARLRPSCEKVPPCQGSWQWSIHDWVTIKSLGMSSRFYATVSLKDPVVLVEMSRASCPGGGFPLTSFIH